MCFSFRTIVMINQCSTHVENLRGLCTSIEFIVNSIGTPVPGTGTLIYQYIH